MTENQNLVIRVVLQGETKRRFNEIKERKGIQNNTDVLRYVINEYYEANPNNNQTKRD